MRPCGPKAGREGFCLGGLYFTLETPSNFQNIKDMLMGFVNSIVLVLLQKLEGQLHQMWDVVVQVRIDWCCEAADVQVQCCLDPAEWQVHSAHWCRPQLQTWACV